MPDLPLSTDSSATISLRLTNGKKECPPAQKRKIAPCSNTASPLHAIASQGPFKEILARRLTQ